MFKNKELTIRSVEKALEVFSLFSEDTCQLSFPEICEKLEFPKSSVYRLIATLENGGFLDHDKYTNKYQPGFKFLKITNNLLKNLDIRQKAYTFMQQIRDEVKETVNLFILKDKKRVCIEQVEGVHMLKRHATIGDQLPLYSGASGKVLLAFQSDDFIDEVLSEKLEPFTSNTITNVDLLRENLKRIRDKGYEITIGEREEGLCSIAVPIRNHKGAVFATLTVSGPEFRFTPELVNKVLTSLIKSGEEISRKAGFIDDSCLKKGGV